MSEEKIIGNVANVIETSDEIIVRVVFHKGRDKVDDVMFSFKKEEYIDEKGNVDYDKLSEKVKEKVKEKIKEIKSGKKIEIHPLMKIRIEEE
jgi:hypothetical protein